VAHYYVTLVVEDKHIREVRHRLLKMYPMCSDSLNIERLKQLSHAERLEAVAGDVGRAAEEVRELISELESWRDNLPESLQGGSKSDELDDAINALETIADELEAVDIEVEFPAAFGA